MIGRLLRKVRLVLRREAELEDIREELDFHLHSEAAQRMRDGQSTEDAISAATLQLGGTVGVLDRTSDVWGMQWLDDLRRDTRTAVRMFFRRPAFSATILATMMLSIGAASGTFSYFYELILRKLPVPEPEKLVLLSNGYTYDAYRQLSERLTSAIVLARGSRVLQFQTDRGIRSSNVEFVSGNYFEVLRVPAIFGRALVKEDEFITSPPYPVVISSGLWADLFANDPTVIGRTFQLSQVPVRVIGVSAAGFGGSELGKIYDLQIPLLAGADFNIPIERSVWLELLARRGRGVSLAQLEGQFIAAATDIDSRTWGGGAGKRYVLADGSRGFSQKRQEVERVVMLLSAAVLVLLLIGGANVAGLLSARALERGGEVAIRLSLGATRSRLIRQLLTENTLLVLGGTIGGLMLAQIFIRSMGVLLTDARLLAQFRVGLNVPAFIGAVSAAVLIMMIFGFVPVWFVRRNASLTAQTGERGSSSGRFHLRRWIVGLQLSLSFLLLSGAIVLGQTLYNLESLDLGFSIDHVAMLSIETPVALQGEPSERLNRVLQQLRRLPTVSSAAISAIGLLSGDMVGVTVKADDSPIVVNETNYLHGIGPDYFKTLRTKILRGRDFTSADNLHSEPVAVVSERFASTYWPGQDPIGRMIDVAGRRQVVGVASNANYRGVREKQPLTIYVPLAQGKALPFATIIVRTTAEPTLILGELASAANAVEPQLIISSKTTLENRRNGSIANERASTIFSILFAGLAILLSMVGVAGAMMANVVSRRREIGIRLALGARPSSIVVLLGRETLVMVLLSIAVGIILAWSSLTFLGSLVYGIEPRSLLALIASACFLICFALLGVTGALKKATRIDPALTLRES